VRSVGLKGVCNASAAAVIAGLSANSDAQTLAARLGSPSASGVNVSLLTVPKSM